MGEGSRCLIFWGREERSCLRLAAAVRSCRRPHSATASRRHGTRDYANSQCQSVECKQHAPARAFSLHRMREGGRRPDEGWGKAKGERQKEKMPSRHLLTLAFFLLPFAFSQPPNPLPSSEEGRESRSASRFLAIPPIPFRKWDYCLAFLPAFAAGSSAGSRPALRILSNCAIISATRWGCSAARFFASPGSAARS